VARPTQAGLPRLEPIAAARSVPPWCKASHLPVVDVETTPRRSHCPRIEPAAVRTARTSFRVMRPTDRPVIELRESRGESAAMFCAYPSSARMTSKSWSTSEKSGMFYGVRSDESIAMAIRKGNMVSSFTPYAKYQVDRTRNERAVLPQCACLITGFPSDFACIQRLQTTAYTDRLQPSPPLSEYEGCKPCHEIPSFILANTVSLDVKCSPAPSLRTNPSTEDLISWRTNANQ